MISKIYIIKTNNYIIHDNLLLNKNEYEIILHHIYIYIYIYIYKLKIIL